MVRNGNTISEDPDGNIISVNADVSFIPRKLELMAAIFLRLNN